MWARVGSVVPERSRNGEVVLKGFEEYRLQVSRAGGTDVEMSDMPWRCGGHRKPKPWPGTCFSDTER